MRNEQTSVPQTYHRRGSKEGMGGWGRSSQPLENFLGKISCFDAIGSQFARVYNLFKELDF